LADDPSVSQVANECGLSTSYFVRAFKQTTGIPPHRWLTKQRVERAKELLRDPDRELADIAQLCGIVDQSHFTRVFPGARDTVPAGGAASIASLRSCDAAIGDAPGWAYNRGKLRSFSRFTSAYLSDIDVATERACWMKTSTAGLNVRFLSVTMQAGNLTPRLIGSAFRPHARALKRWTDAGIKVKY
jgi:AraC-like DNA-binding protein